MKLLTIKRFLSSPTVRLAGTYLAIIMVMSIGFSFVFYNTSSHELGRQLPPNSLVRGYDPDQMLNNTPHNINMFFQQRISEGRSALLTHLLFLNIGALLIGGLVSYFLARRSLRPIEEAMDAQSQFVSDASHELRTPLTAIQTSNEVFLRKTKPTLDEATALIARNTEDLIQLKALSDGLLNLARHQSLDTTLVPLELQTVVGDAMNQVIVQATAKDVAVHETVPARLQVRAEAGSLAQVVVILLDNAVKYSNEHANIYITAERKNRFVYLQVRDEGIGIRASDLPHIFRRFYRADSARSRQSSGGYGLGLAIAQRIMEQYGGDITAASTPGKGATFTLKLPAV